MAYSGQGDRRDDQVTFTSSNSKVATVTTDGRLSAVAPGTATITAKAGPATHPFAIQVSANNVARLSVDPATSNVRTGDVMRFKAAGRMLPARRSRCRGALGGSGECRRRPDRR